MQKIISIKIFVNMTNNQLFTWVGFISIQKNFHLQASAFFNLGFHWVWVRILLFSVYGYFKPTENWATEKVNCFTK